MLTKIQNQLKTFNSINNCERLDTTKSHSRLLPPSQNSIIVYSITQNKFRKRKDDNNSFFLLFTFAKFSTRLL